MGVTPTQGSSPRPGPGEQGSTTVGQLESTSTHRPVTAVGPGDEPGLWQRIDRSDLARTLSVAACAVAVGVAHLLGASSWVLAPVSVVALVAGCWPIIVEAWEDVKARRMSMELSMLIAIAAAAAIGEWTTALVITTFVLAAEILEDLSMDRGRDALSDLMSFLPAMVRVRRGNSQVEIPLAEVRPGMVVVVEPGSRVPVDGTVLAGSASLDQSRLTGESLPVDVQVGDSVLAGSITVAGALEVTTRRVGEDSTFGQIIATVRGAQESRAPVQRLADRLAGILVFIALGAALVTFLVTRDARATISVVIVAGACGIAAGTPLAILASIARAARAGAFVRDGTHLEVLSGVDTVVLDKTGTLTLGQARVVGVRPAPGVDEGDLLAPGGGCRMALGASCGPRAHRPGRGTRGCRPRAGERGTRARDGCDGTGREPRGESGQCTTGAGRIPGVGSGGGQSGARRGGRRVGGHPVGGRPAAGRCRALRV